MNSVRGRRLILTPSQPPPSDRLQLNKPEREYVRRLLDNAEGCEMRDRLKERLQRVDKHAELRRRGEP